MVGVVITTHGNLASAFLEVAETILGKQEAVTAVGVMAHDGKKEITEHLVQAVSHVRQREGVLILTGIFGESDYKMCVSLFANQHVRVVAGLNLPMLFKVLTYRSKLNLEDLAACACTSGKAGIIACESMVG